MARPNYDIMTYDLNKIFITGLLRLIYELFVYIFTCNYIHGMIWYMISYSVNFKINLFFLINLYHFMGKFNRRHIGDIFFPRK